MSGYYDNYLSQASLNASVIAVLGNSLSQFAFLIYQSKSCSPLDEVEAVSNNTKLFHKKLKNQFCFSIDSSVK